MGIAVGAASAADPGRSREGPEVSLGVDPVESRLGTATSDEPGLTGGMGRAENWGGLDIALRALSRRALSLDAALECGLTGV